MQQFYTFLIMQSGSVDQNCVLLTVARDLTCQRLNGMRGTHILDQLLASDYQSVMGFKIRLSEKFSSLLD